MSARPVLTAGLSLMVQGDAMDAITSVRATHSNYKWAIELKMQSYRSNSETCTGTLNREQIDALAAFFGQLSELSRLES